MAQFDIHRNIGRHRQIIPFVVVVQSSLFDHYRRRVVVPLVLRSSLPGTEVLNNDPLNPLFFVEGIEVVLHPLELVSVGLDQLGEKIGSLAEEGNRIAAALDALLTQAWK